MIRSLFQNLYTPASLRGSVGASGFSLITGRSIGFVRGVLLAWLITQREFGLFQVAVAGVNLLVPLSNLGLSHGTLRYAPMHEARGTLRVFVLRASVMVLSTSIVICGFVLLVPARWTGAVIAAGADVDALTSDASGAAATSTLIWTAVICTFSLVVFHLPVDLMKGLRLFRAASWMEVTGVTLFSTAALIGPLLGYDSAHAVLLAYGFGNLATVAFFTPPLVRYIRSQNADAEAARRTSLIDRAYVRYSLWIAASLISWHALQQYVFWHLARVSGSVVAGTYFATRLFAQLIYLGGQSIARALASNVTRVWETEGRQAAIDRLEAGSKLGFLVVFGGAAFVSLIKPWILLAFPGEYAVGVRCFDPLVLAYAWFGALEFLIIRFHLEEQSKFTFVTSVAGAVANVVLAFVVLGAPWAVSSMESDAVLVAAAWVCAAGSGAAVLTCVLVLTATGRAPRLSSLVLMMAFASVGIAGQWGAIVWGAFALAAVGGVWVFTPGERAIIAGWLRGR